MAEHYHVRIEKDDMVFSSGHFITDDGATTTDTLTVTVQNVAPVVTVEPQSQIVQYSDQIQDVTFGFSDVDSETLTPEVSYSFGGGAFQAGLPDAGSLEPAVELAFSGSATVNPLGRGSTGSWTVSGIRSAPTRSNSP